MAFDQSTRNRLARFVSDARRILTDEFTRQCKQDFGIDPDTGDVSEIARLTHLNDTQRASARILRETIDYYVAGSPSGGKQSAVERIIREQAFTVLNRLCALRMAESRGIIIESVGNGQRSKGFQLYTRICGTSLGETGDAYRCYLFSVFDELTLDLAALFDRFSPQGRLFPSETALVSLLEEINHADITSLWAEDETIGWLYQYFNTQEERRDMRESAAPRNSRELAVRNQFFTPRYVVEFLVDNTLGRIWHEMTKGESAVKDICRFMVRSPHEVFRGDAVSVAHDDGQVSPPSIGNPAYSSTAIAHRPLKDPREIKMLDPACGSMHFGLYSFDLFERIYEEAWELESRHGMESLERPVGMKSLHDTYTSKAEFLRDVPRMIIERNIHGVDIDPRAVQVAGLSLWLRAQRSWHDQGAKAAERPQIRRSNLVCAEPMPGDKALLDDFLSQLRDSRLESLLRRCLELPGDQKVRATPRMADAMCDLVRTVWQAMTLAGEAGSLLQIDSLLASAVAAARAEWEDNAPLFRVSAFAIDTETSGIRYSRSVPGDGVDFWSQAELLVLAALEDYAARATEMSSLRRQLFTHDTSQGFAFIDLMRHRFDVVLMNPPFGEPTVKSRPYLAESLPDSKADIGMAFVTRFTMRLAENGRLGAITNRVFVGNDSLEEWRVQYLLGKKATLSVLLDLGFGVLDDALVEAAAYVVERRKEPERLIRFIRVLDERDKAGAVEDLLARGSARPRTLVFDRLASDFHRVPGAVLAYQLPASLIGRIKAGDTLVAAGGRAVQGIIPSDDYRFVRLAWEVPSAEIGQGRRWPYYAKGGEYNPYWDDIHLTVNWADAGKEIRNFADANGKLRSRPQNLSFLFRPAATYPERTTSDFCPRVLPAGCVFSATGQCVFSNADDATQLLGYIAGAQSRPFKLLIDAITGSGDASVPGSAAVHYRSGLLQVLPAPLWRDATVQRDRLVEIARLAAGRLTTLETSRLFAGIVADSGPLASVCLSEQRERLESAIKTLELHHHIEQSAVVELGFSNADSGLVDTIIGPHPTEYPSELSDADRRDLSSLWALSDSDVIRNAVNRHGARRQLTKKSFVADRRLELAAHTLQRSAIAIAREVIKQGMLETGAMQSLADRIVSFTIGCGFGRWDARQAVVHTDNALPTDLFAALPSQPPAALVCHVLPPDYPLVITPDGVLVDDPSSKWDITDAVRNALSVIWKSRASVLEHDLCDALGADSLRAYLHGRDGFFATHLSKYSQSRRQAPIYWPLTTRSGAYTVWLYYHRLTDQSLFGAINNHVDPKITHVAAEASRLRSRTSRSSAEEADLTQMTDLEVELREFRAELLRIASFWKPNLNDGVQITAAPLWRLFRHKAWQKALKETWESLEAGDYDWAHLAYGIWPDRVREKCKHDKSLSIAHGLESLYQEPVAAAGAKRGRKPKAAEPMLGENAE